MISEDIRQFLQERINARLTQARIASDLGEHERAVACMTVATSLGLELMDGMRGDAQKGKGADIG